MPESNRQHWGLNPRIDFLNHGSFGACPTVVLNAQRDWIDLLEKDPIDFLAPERTLLTKLLHVRSVLQELVNAPAKDIALIRNATEGVNAVVRSFPFETNDEVVITSHGYNACNNAIRFAAERFGAVVKVAETPFPIESPEQVVASIESMFSERTRLLVVDHVTSSTGLVFPVDELVRRAHRHGIRVLVDGAHAPGMLSVDLQQINADYYTANHHKWLCAPKASGFLYVKPEFQEEVRPAIISHGANADTQSQSRFESEFSWTGTYDPSPVLSLPTAIDFITSLHPGGLSGLQQKNHELVLAGRERLLQKLNVPSPAPSEMLGSLATIPLPVAASFSPADAVSLQRKLFYQHQIEVPVFKLSSGLPCFRISAQIYNQVDQYERLANVLGEIV